MIPFDFQSRTRIVFAPGAVARLGDIAGELGARRVLVVSDEGVIKAGHTERGLEALRGAGIEAYLFDQVQENPTTKDVEAGVTLAQRYDPEMIVGFGGGSSMDCAKGINFILSNGGQMKDSWGVGSPNACVDACPDWSNPECLGLSCMQFLARKVAPKLGVKYGTRLSKSL